MDTKKRCAILYRTVSPTGTVVAMLRLQRTNRNDCDSQPNLTDLLLLHSVPRYGKGATLCRYGK